MVTNIEQNTYIIVANNGNVLTAGNNLFKINKGNTKPTCETSSKLTIRHRNGVSDCCLMSFFPSDIAVMYFILI